MPVQDKLAKALAAKTLQGRLNYMIDAFETVHGNPVLDELLHGLVEMSTASSRRRGLEKWVKKLIRYRVLR